MISEATAWFLEPFCVLIWTCCSVWEYYLLITLLICSHLLFNAICVMCSGMRSNSHQVFSHYHPANYHLSLYFFVVLRMSTLRFSSNFATSLLTSDSLSHWNNFSYLNTPPYLYIASNSNVSSLVFLVLRALVALNLHIASTPTNIYLYVLHLKA